MKLKLFGVGDDFVAKLLADFITKGVMFLHFNLGLSEDKVWRLVYEVLKQLDRMGIHLHLKQDIDTTLLHDPEYVEGKVKSDVDEALKKHEDLTGPPEPVIVPVFSETTEGDTPLGGGLRLRSPWIGDSSETGSSG